MTCPKKDETGLAATWLAGLLLALCVPVQLAAEDLVPPSSVQKIWNYAPHNAFTDLIQFDGDLYCTFREGTGHVPGEIGTDGTIRVIKSTDSENPIKGQWQSVALIQESEVDLRDPKLSVTPEGKLMLLMGGSYYDGRTLLKMHPRVCFMEPGQTQFGPIIPVQIDKSVSTAFDWLWRVTWQGDIGYGVVYQRDATAQKRGLLLVSTKDGVHYKLVHAFNTLADKEPPQVTGFPNETTIRFLDDGRMAMVIRREKADQNGWVGVAQAPFTQWKFEPFPARLGGPDFLILSNGQWALGTRKYVGGAKTILAVADDSGTMLEVAELPSRGDTSYPGFVVHDGSLLMSYYASHEDKTSIYLARFPLEDLLKIQP